MQTKRLNLRVFTEEDTGFLFKLNNDREVNQFRSRDTRSFDECRQDIVGWNDKYNNHFLNVYLVETFDESRPLGMIFLVEVAEDTVEIGYRFLKEEWKKGYCFESSDALISEYFRLHPKGKVVAETHHQNVNSINFLKRSGFIEESYEGVHGGKIFVLKNMEG